MDLELAGKRVLVTGASRGIGLAIAEAFAREGSDLVLVSRDAGAPGELAGRLSREHGAHVACIAADLSRGEDQRRLVRECGGIDVLVNNAGAIPPGTLWDVDESRWRESWDLKVFGYLNLIRALYPALAERAGVIVNIIGSAGERPTPGYIAGSAANAALMALVRALGVSAPADGVRVVGINPGPVATRRHEVMQRAKARARWGDEERWEELAADLPYGRAARPVEIADAAVFLASARSGYTNGAILTIDGGASLA